MTNNEKSATLSGVAVDRLVILREHGKMDLNTLLIKTYKRTGKIIKRQSMEVWVLRKVKAGKIKRIGWGLFEAI